MMASIQTMIGGDGVVVTIICSLLGFVSLCIKGLISAYKNNQKFISEIIDKDNVARERMADQHTEAWNRLSESNATNSERLASAIEKLSEELKHRNSDYLALKGMLRGQADQVRRLD